jgi:SAM-dependent methyltransferase
VRRLELLVETVEAVRPERILDAGSGSGVALSLIGARWPRVTLVGVDLSYAMLEQARREGLAERPLTQASVEALPFADRAFDLVYALGVVDYLEDPGSFFASVRRVLRPKGVFVFTYPNDDGLGRKGRSWLRNLRGPRPPDVVAIPVSSARVDEMLEQQGFELAKRDFITYGNGLVSLPWTRILNRKLERWCRGRVARRLAWTALCVARVA